MAVSGLGFTKPKNRFGYRLVVCSHGYPFVNKARQESAVFSVNLSDETVTGAHGLMCVVVYT